MLETTHSWLLESGATIAIILFSLYVYFKISYSYWEKRGVPTVKPTVPFGNFPGSIISGINPAFEIVDLYKAFKGHKVGGLYKLSGPSLLLLDPDVIKDVLVKNFEYFYSRGRVFDDEYEPLDGHLFSLSGTKWRNLRVKLTPIFTTKKMKMMFGAVVECGKDLQAALLKSVDNGDPIEIHDFLARYSTDVISSCAFGIQCNCLKNPEAEFRQWGRRVFAPHFRQRMTSLMQVVFPSLVYTFKLSLVPREVSNYFQRMVRETVEYREKHNVERNDFMQLMIQLKNKTLSIAEEEDLNYLEKQTDKLKSNVPFEISMKVIAAQAFVFFIAGFETSSNTMAFCLYELARHPDMQERVRTEIDAVLQKHGGEITYEAITEMEYLDKVFCETLRMYPPVPAVTRECTKTIKLPGTDVTVEKGVHVLLPILALHRDPKYYPDPERFDPERFSEEERKKRPQFSYIPFGEGPRLCIGMRFAMMQVKVGLINVLSKFEVQASDKTPPIAEIDTRAVIMTPKGGMWLNLVKRQ
ncbi:Cytochrome P450 6k1 [Cryptotermes secundus]|uniref:Cytochrome P450 6k1 n=2 Tax=Cryptotermes secundus TaxID=105785 RepID=A0A2J7PHC0_9NEOP|nr:Cytochrome P450 6k1 [Cryptotermes secundus]PNF15725.1 Cytochrome P450 6k1 [Cryptotermes secundus]